MKWKLTASVICRLGASLSRFTIIAFCSLWLQRLASPFEVPDMDFGVLAWTVLANVTGRGERRSCVHSEKAAPGAGNRRVGYNHPILPLN